MQLQRAKSNGLHLGVSCCVYTMTTLAVAYSHEAKGEPVPAAPPRIVEAHGLQKCPKLVEQVHNTHRRCGSTVTTPTMTALTAPRMKNEALAVHLSCVHQCVSATVVHSR